MCGRVMAEPRRGPTPARARFGVGRLVFAATIAVAAGVPAVGQQSNARDSAAPPFPPVGNLAQVMRGILFPSSNLIFNVQTHNPSDPPAPRPPATANQGGFSWVNWGDGIYSPW